MFICFYLCFCCFVMWPKKKKKTFATLTLVRYFQSCNGIISIYCYVLILICIKKSHIFFWHGREKYKEGGISFFLSCSSWSDPLFSFLTDLPIFFSHQIFFSYCHCCQVTIFKVGTNKSFGGCFPFLIKSIRWPLVAMERNQWLNVAKASQPRYCIISVTVPSDACAICISVAKHSGVFVMGMRLAGSSVKFFNAWMAANRSSSSFACLARKHRQVNTPSMMASSCRQGLSCDRFCNAKQACFRTSSFFENVALTNAGTTLRVLKSKNLEFPRWRVRCASILTACSCEGL